MAWTLDWTVANQDWAAVANINDFQKATNERKDAIQVGAADALKVPGDDVQEAAFWNAMQTWIETNYGSFVVSHDAGVARAADYYDNRATIDAYGNLAAVFSAAGLGTTDWRRYTTHPDDAGADLGGKIVAGDIIGPWLFEDLQLVLNVLIWTAGSSMAWTDKIRYYGEDDNEITWAAAKAGAEAVWAVSALAQTRPEAYSYGNLNIGGVFTARLYRGALYLKIGANIGTGCSRAIDWHAYAEKWHDVWDANGDGLIENSWAKWLTDSPGQAVAQPQSSVRLGSDVTILPVWCDEPPGAEQVQSKGYRVEGGGTPSGRCLVRWDIANGFDYT